MTYRNDHIVDVRLHSHEGFRRDACALTGLPEGLVSVVASGRGLAPAQVTVIFWAPPGAPLSGIRRDLATQAFAGAVVEVVLIDLEATCEREVPTVANPLPCFGLYRCPPCRERRDAALAAHTLGGFEALRALGSGSRDPDMGP